MSSVQSVSVLLLYALLLYILSCGLQVLALGPSDNKFRKKIRSEKPLNLRFFFSFFWVRFFFSRFTHWTTCMWGCMHVCTKITQKEKKIICSRILSHKFWMDSCSESRFIMRAMAAKRRWMLLSSDIQTVGHSHAAGGLIKIDGFIRWSSICVTR